MWEYVPPKRHIPTTLHNATSQNTVLFIVTVVKHSNQTYVNTNYDSFITRYFVFCKEKFDDEGNNFCYITVKTPFICCDKISNFWGFLVTPHSKYASAQIDRSHMWGEINRAIFNYISAPLTAKFKRSLYPPKNGHRLQSSYTYGLFTLASYLFITDRRNIWPFPGGLDNPFDNTSITNQQWSLPSRSLPCSSENAVKWWKRERNTWRTR